MDLDNGIHLEKYCFHLLCNLLQRNDFAVVWTGIIFHFDKCIPWIKYCSFDIEHNYTDRWNHSSALHYSWGYLRCNCKPCRWYSSSFEYFHFDTSDYHNCNPPYLGSHHFHNYLCRITACDSWGAQHHHNSIRFPFHNHFDWSYADTLVSILTLCVMVLCFSRNKRMD